MNPDEKARRERQAPHSLSATAGVMSIEARTETGLRSTPIHRRGGLTPAGGCGKMLLVKVRPETAKPQFKSRDARIMANSPSIHSLDELIDASKASPEFKEAVRELSHGETQDRIDFNWGAPLVKVMRVIMKVLETYPDLPIERAKIHGVSGCSDFVGSVELQPGDLSLDFDWNCRWQAQQMGWTNFFGEPDQIRAAHHLGYQCFRRFEPRNVRRPTQKT